MLLVEHTRCSEHGELVHSDGAHSHVVVEHGSAGSLGVRGASDPNPDEAHDHCSVSADRRDALVLIVDPQVATPTHDAPSRSTLASTFAVTYTARFRVAPKNSPPA
jgi:hypothetical protein